MDGSVSRPARPLFWTLPIISESGEALVGILVSVGEDSGGFGRIREWEACASAGRHGPQLV